VIRVLLAEDHAIVRNGLVELLAEAEDVEVVATAADGEQALASVAELRPDVVLMDISMPVKDGIEAAREIHATNSDASILMLTGSNSRSDVDGARRAGAAGYVTKDRIASELIDAIVEIAER